MIGHLENCVLKQRLLKWPGRIFHHSKRINSFVTTLISNTSLHRNRCLGIVSNFIITTAVQYDYLLVLTCILVQLYIINIINNFKS